MTEKYRNCISLQVQKITSILVALIFKFFFAISSHRRSAQGNVRKNLGILNSFIKAIATYKNGFQYAGAYLTKLIKVDILSLATNFLNSACLILCDCLCCKLGTFNFIHCKVY